MNSPKGIVKYGVLSNMYDSNSTMSLVFDDQPTTRNKNVYQSNDTFRRRL